MNAIQEPDKTFEDSTTQHTVSDDQQALIPAEPSTEVALHRPNASPLQRPAQSFDELMVAVNMISQANIVPGAYRGKPADIAVAGLMGAEQGWPLMVALRYIHVVDGKPTLSAEAMNAKIQQAGHRMKIDVDSNRCRIEAERRDNGNAMTYEFSMVDAKQAGLLTKNNWQSYPKAMMMARAISQIGRTLFPDILSGMGYTPEELGDDSWCVEPEQSAAEAAAATTSAGLMETLASQHAKLTDAERGRVDGWLQRITRDNGDQAFPNGFADLTENDNQDFLATVNRNIARALAERSDDDDDGVIDAEIVESPESEDSPPEVDEPDSQQAGVDPRDIEDGEVYEAIAGVDGVFTISEAKTLIGWVGHGSVVRVGAALARQVEYGNVFRVSVDGEADAYTTDATLVSK